MTDPIKIQSRNRQMKEAEAAGRVADSHEVRLALMAQYHSGEKTLGQVQAELTNIQRNAKKAGLMTRNQAYRQ